MSVFDFKSYIDFLNTWIANQPRNGRGLKALIARYAQCNPAYVTLVMKGDAHFSLEQIERLKPVLQLTDEEFDFLFLLVEKEKAGTQSLKNYFNKKVEVILQQRLQLKSRVESKSILKEELQSRYFSNWLYAAVHTALTVPAMNNAQIIAQQLRVDEKSVKDVINFFLEAKLIEKTKSGYAPGEVRIHLPHDSDFIVRHHANWRIQSLKALDRATDKDFHYSSVVSISQDDFFIIREMILKFIETTKKVVKDSKEETLASIGIDFFKVSAD